MTYRLRLRSPHRLLEVQTGDVILDAAEFAGLDLPSSCREGVCGTCKARCITGHVTHGNATDGALTAGERAQGYFLLCQAEAASDITLDVMGEALAPDRPFVRVPAVVSAVAPATSQVSIVTVTVTGEDYLRAAPGQYVDLIDRGGDRRSYVVARVEGGRSITLHVRHAPGSAFTSKLLGAHESAEAYVLEGPFGTFGLGAPANSPAIFLVEGAGLAIAEAMIPARLAAGVDVVLARFGAADDDFHGESLVQAWRAGHPHFHDVRIAPATDVAALAHTVARLAVNVNGVQVYVAGRTSFTAPAAEAARRGLGVAEGDLHVESFVTTAERAAT